MQISHSRAEGFLLCERKDYYGYTLGLKRKTESASLALGSAVHECLDVFYKAVLEAGNTRKAQLKAFEGARELAEAHAKLLVSGGKYADTDHKRWTLLEVLEHYFADEPLIRKGYRVLVSEGEFHVDLGEEITILFRVDLIVADEEGKRWVVDHKVVWDFYTFADAQLQPQMVKYLGLLRFLGHNVSGGMYNMLRSRRIGGEKMLKAELVQAVARVLKMDGEQAAYLNKQTVDALQKAAEEQGIQHTKPVAPEKLNQTLPLEFSDERIRRTLEEQYDVSLRIQERQALPAGEIEQLSLRVANKMVCQHCSYRPICVAELNDDDTRLVLEDYDVKEQRDLPPTDEDEDDAE